MIERDYMVTVDYADIRPPQSTVVRAAVRQQALKLAIGWAGLKYPVKDFHILEIEPTSTRYVRQPAPNEPTTKRLWITVEEV